MRRLETATGNNEEGRGNRRHGASAMRELPNRRARWLYFKIRDFRFLGA
jgi:hypothetical protein